MTQKKLEVISGPTFDDLIGSLHMDFPINFFVVETPDETAWELSVTMMLVAAKTNDRTAWTFKGTSYDPDTDETVIVEGVLSNDAPYSGSLTIFCP